MEPELIRRLINFHYWACDRLLAVVTTLPEEQYTQPLAGGWGTIHETMAHLAESEGVWWARINGYSPSKLEGAARMPTLESVQTRWTANETALKTYLSQIEVSELNRVVSYSNTKGEPFANTVWQILLHVINHTTEHRAQISSMLTQLGVSHPGMDLITFWREGEG